MGDNADSPGRVNPSTPTIAACEVCRGSSTCSWCCGEGYDLSRSIGMHPCGLCGGSGSCSFCQSPNDEPTRPQVS